MTTAPRERHPERRPDLRVADADREQTLDLLRAHAGAGRLDAEELGRRAEAALAARTGADLDGLTVDLPPLPPDPARRARAWRAEARTYAAVIALLVAVWLLAGAGHPWPLYAALGWGIPLLLSRPRAGGGATPGQARARARRAATA